MAVFALVALGCLVVGGCGSGSAQEKGVEVQFSNGPFLQTLSETKLNFKFAQLYSTARGVIALEANTDYTLLAPTDDAMNKYFVQTNTDFDEVAADPVASSSIVLRHLFKGLRSATSLLNSSGESLEAMDGSTVTLSVVGSSIVISDGHGNKVVPIAVDIPTSDGILHVVDAVIAAP